jgi:elongation factor 3
VFLDPEIAKMYDPNSEEDRNTVIDALEGVGFAKGAVSKGASQLMEVTALSGGWKMILALARAMLCKADIMLLDEPTNHLDVEKVAWVKNYLINMDTVTCIIVSHDSKFMDDVCTHIIHFEERKLQTYIGNLAAFVAKVPSARAYYEFKSDKLEFIFPKPTALEGVKSKGKPILSMTNVSFTYPGATKRVLNDVSVKCTLNSRIAVIGPNGAGKSTAIKVLTGENPPCTGTTWKHPQMRFAYVAQHAFHHLESHLDKTPCEYILWRYQAGFDKELAARGGAVISKDEAAAMAQPIIVKVEVDGKLVEKKKVVERFCSRRKKKATYEYETKFMGEHMDNNMWMPRERMESLGFAKMLLLCDEEENSRMGAARPLTQRFVLEQFGELGLEEEYAAHVQISNLSGGQKVKVVLAAAMWGSPHLVILDEPTNYLDRDSLAALAGAIRNFEGGVLLISHNRDFVEHVCKTLWIMADGRLRAEGEEDVDEKIVEELGEEDTIDHLGNTVKGGKKKELTPQEVKKMKKSLAKKIKAGDELTEEEEEFCIEYDL